jgi:hypothetical protein
MWMKNNCLRGSASCEIYTTCDLCSVGGLACSAYLPRRKFLCIDKSFLCNKADVNKGPCSNCLNLKELEKHVAKRLYHCLLQTA